MGLFNKLFGRGEKDDPSTELSETEQLKKGEIIIAAGDDQFFKVIRSLTDQQKESIEKSTILLRTGQLYMHYWTENLENKNREDPEWQNKVMFFWKAEEQFPKKSLPPTFENFEHKYFLFAGDTSKITLKSSKALPWFGMPGLGEKHVCEMNGEQITIPELNKMGLVEYVEQVSLTNDNLDLLTKREDYFFWVDERITSFRNGNFYLKDKPVPIDIAYSIGGIHLFKKVMLE